MFLCINNYSKTFSRQIIYAASGPQIPTGAPSWTALRTFVSRPLICPPLEKSCGRLCLVSMLISHKHYAVISSEVKLLYTKTKRSRRTNAILLGGPPLLSAIGTANVLTYLYSIIDTVAAAVVTFLLFVHTVAQSMSESAAALQYSS